MNSTTENESDYTRLTRDLTNNLHRARDHMIKQGGPVPRSLYRLTAEFRFGHNQPSGEQGGGDFNDSLIELAIDTLEVGVEFIYDECDTLEARQSAKDTGTIAPFEYAAIDYPGTEEGWPRATEPPLLNAVIFVTAPLKQEFEEIAAGDFSNLDPHYRWCRPQSLKWQEIEYSKSGVELAVEHVLKLCKTLPWKAFDDGGSICFVRNPFNDRGELNL